MRTPLWLKDYYTFAELMLILLISTPEGLKFKRSSKNFDFITITMIF